MKFQNTIRKSIKEKRHNKIFRKHGSEEDTDHGFILKYSKNFVLYQNMGDFLLNGYSIISLNEIDKIRYNHFDKFFESMLEKEEIKSSVGLSLKIELQDWQTVFESISREKQYVIIHCEQEDDGRFLIGKIEQIGSNCVWINYFSADGVFSSKLTKINFEEITKVEFDTRYVNVFSKYLRRKE